MWGGNRRIAFDLENMDITELPVHLPPRPGKWYRTTKHFTLTRKYHILSQRGKFTIMDIKGQFTKPLNTQIRIFFFIHVMVIFKLQWTQLSILIPDLTYSTNAYLPWLGSWSLLHLFTSSAIKSLRSWPHHGGTWPKSLGLRYKTGDNPIEV